MCVHGTSVLVTLLGRDGDIETTGIDACIADIVVALNAGGVRTRDSCCGHGRNAGGISLADGRWLVITTRDAAISACGTLPHAAPRTDAFQAIAASASSGYAGPMTDWERTMLDLADVSPRMVSMASITLAVAIAAWREGNEEDGPNFPDDVCSDAERVAYICNLTPEPWRCFAWMIENRGRLAQLAHESGECECGSEDHEERTPR